MLLPKDYFPASSPDINGFIFQYKNLYISNGLLHGEFDTEAFIDHYSFYLSDNSYLCTILDKINVNMTDDEIISFLTDFPIFDLHEPIKIETIRRRLIDLIYLYDAYLYIVWDKWDCGKDDGFKDSINLFIPTEKESIKINASIPRELYGVMAMIAYISTEKDNVINPTYFVFPGKKGTESIWAFENVYSALLYQLFYHIEHGKNEKGEFEEAICKECGQPFIRNSRKYIYCQRCGSESERARRYRNRKKSKEGKAKNAQKVDS